MPQVNGTLDPEVLELRKQIEKQSSDLGNATRTVTELRSKVNYDFFIFAFSIKGRNAF
jgi:hypothetical protein